MNWKDIEPKTIELRNKLIETLGNVRHESASKNIPDADPSLNVAAELLANPAYDIVVCGEVKKGKSTFINAVIGQELLPTGVKETTSQVFRISNNSKESFYLVFTDGSSEAITRDELSRYGSQVDADLMGEPAFKNRQLDYIQINIPIEFLPQGVSIVDTPGLGALYKSHEEITNRYIANAAAVVFVFDPSQPMVRQEKEFLEKVFNVTPFVMFVMTKVDCYDEANWVFQISRTETLLKEAFEKKCYALPKVYPVASTTLFDASREKDSDVRDELVEVSYFPEAYAELLKIMYITVGLSRTKFAWAEAERQKRKVQNVLNEQIKMVTSTSKEDQEKIREKKALARQSFDQLWGPASNKRREVMQDVQSIIGGVQNRASQVASSTGNIYKKYLAKIDELNSKGEIESFARSLGRDLIKDVGEEWQSIAKNAQNEVYGTLQVLKARMESVNTEGDFQNLQEITLTGLTGNERFQSFKSKYFDASLIGTVGGVVLSFAGVALAPLTILVGVITYGFLGGRSEAERREMEKNKGNLKSGLANMMNEINAQLFHVPMSGGNKSMVQQFTADLSTAVEKAMTAMYESQKKQLENEQKQLDEQARLGAEQRLKELAGLNEQVKKWMDISAVLSEEEKLIKYISNELA